MKLKLLAKSASVILAIFAAFLICLVIYEKNHPDAKPTLSTITNQQVSPKVDELNNLVNQKRMEVGLTALSLDNSLSQSAQEKCMDIVANDYWSHTNKNGEEFYIKIKNHINYIKAGENLAAGYNKSQSVVDGWMSSTEHRENILDPLYNNVGYAICQTSQEQKSLNKIGLSGQQYIVVQQFAKL